MTFPQTGLWRHHDRLPVRDAAAVVTLGEGDTPVIDISATVGAAVGLRRLWLKCEDRNPTGSFKARIAAVAYALVRERGLAGAVGTSSGNGGAAAAAYAAAAGSRAVLFTLSDTVAAKLREIVAVGGIACRVTGVGHDAASTRTVADLIAAAAAQAGCYPLLTGFHYAPEAMTGVQTIAYELAEQTPYATRVYLPVGGGGLLTGVHRGYRDLAGPQPMLIGVQPAGAGSLRAAVEGHPEGIAGQVTTAVSGLQMAALFDAVGAPEALRATGGHDVAVPDTAIEAAQALLARFGLLVEPAGATALAGAIADLAAGRLDPDEPIVVVATGAGHKDTAALDRLVAARLDAAWPDDATVVPTITPDEVPERLAQLLGGRP
ncbi:pyridoxal-phosphate dependent enzyme [Propionibacteriaceae bacterium Y2011]